MTRDFTSDEIHREREMVLSTSHGMRRRLASCLNKKRDEGENIFLVFSSSSLQWFACVCFGSIRSLFLRSLCLLLLLIRLELVRLSLTSLVFSWRQLSRLALLDVRRHSPLIRTRAFDETMHAFISVHRSHSVYLMNMEIWQEDRDLHEDVCLNIENLGWIHQRLLAQHGTSIVVLLAVAQPCRSG